VYVCGRGLNSKGNRGCGKRGEGEDDFLPSRSCINGWDLDPDWTLTLTLTLTLKLVLQQLGLEVLWRWTFTLVIWRVCYHVKCFLHLLGYGICWTMALDPTFGSLPLLELVIGWTGFFGESV
jgi:hypothetical protein